MKSVVVSGAFDSLRSRDIRFLHEASKLGEVHLHLWSDDLVREVEGSAPDCPQEERLYVLQSIRYVQAVSLLETSGGADVIPLPNDARPDVWAVDRAHDNSAKRAFCAGHGIAYRVVEDNDLLGFPEYEGTVAAGPPDRKKVIVTGCFDWFHSGHVRFFEEVSELGELYAVVGHDANVRLLKGDGHPLFPQDERRYMVGAVRYVAEALISTGHGWMDAEPEVARIRPDIYAVNEDGDEPEKRTFCKEHGLEYVVLKRAPKEGLPARTSTGLRGF
jgi:cytidyltransferase-like protein